MRPTRITQLIDFLRWHEAESIYLVGDIVDGWRLRRSWYWDEAHDEAVRLVLRLARAGTRVTYIPGNHDEMFRSWLPLGLELGGVRLRKEAVHVAADGRRFLVVHGDEFDGAVCCARCLALLGDHAYESSLVLNRWFNAARRRLGYPYWSLSRWLKRQVGEAVRAIDRFAAAAAREARRRGFHGAICGHIHHPEIRDLDGMLYMNAGDWVENCTALVEHADGRFALIDWAAEARLSLAAGRDAAAAAALSEPV
jgi:UDP-2,3-diacylglucosamine pyrophosphatase LpxH